MDNELSIEVPNTLEVIPSTAFPVINEGLIGTCVEVVGHADKVFCWFAPMEFTVHVLQMFSGA